jgi:hypothetical protein
MRFVHTLVMFSLLTASGVADEAKKPKFGKACFPDAIRFVSATSEDREVTTLMFDNFVLATASGKGEMVSAETKTFSVTSQLESDGAVTATLDIRGFVSVSEGGSAALVVHAGGETTVVDLKKAIAASVTKMRKPEEPLYLQAKETAEAAGYKVSGQPRGSENYMARISGTFAKDQPLQATVILLVDRLTAASSSAMITVDTIDIGVKAAPADKATKDSEKKPEVAKADKKNEKDSAVEKPAAEKSEKKMAKKESKKSAGEKPVIRKVSAEKTEEDAEKDIEEMPEEESAESAPEK